MGYPDDQDIVQWLGPVLATGTDVAVPGVGGLVLGPFTVTTYSYLVLALGAAGGRITATVAQWRAAGPVTAGGTDTWPNVDAASGVRPFALHGDTVSVRFDSATPPGQISYAIYGGNTAPTEEAATADTMAAIDVPAVAGMLWTGSAFTRPRAPRVIGNRLNTAIVAGTPAALIVGAAGQLITLLALQLSMSVAGQIFLKDAGGVVLRSPQLAAGGIWELPYIPGGYYRTISGGDSLDVDVSVNANVGGWAGATRE